VSSTWTYCSILILMLCNNCYFLHFNPQDHLNKNSNSYSNVISYVINLSLNNSVIIFNLSRCSCLAKVPPQWTSCVATSASAAASSRSRGTHLLRSESTSSSAAPTLSSSSLSPRPSCWKHSWRITWDKLEECDKITKSAGWTEASLDKKGGNVIELYMLSMTCVEFVKIWDLYCTL